MSQRYDSATIYYYAAAGQAKEVLFGALTEAMPGNIALYSCAAACELPRQGSSGMMAVFDGALPGDIPATLACLYIARDEREAPALQGGYQRICYLPCRIGRIIDDCLACLRLSAYARLPQKIRLGNDTLLDWRGCALHHPRLGTVDLTNKERDILIALYEADGKRMDRQALMDCVWAYARDTETHTLESHIYRLRQKIEDDPGNPCIIVTAGDGYSLGGH